MTDRDTTTRTRASAFGVGGVFHRMAVHDRVLRPDSERTTVATTKCTKGGCKLDGGRHACATASVAILAAALLFSMMKGWPSRSDIHCPVRRVVRSVCLAWSSP